MIDKLKEIAIEAGKIILDVYKSKNYAIELKIDQTPLTIADKLSHNFIVNKLNTLFPQMPVISEEGKTIRYEKRKYWDEFFLVDPLDGTKEFINRNGEFTVNIALVKDNKPQLGVINIPAAGLTYYGMAESGSYKKTKNEEKSINVSSINLNEEITVVQSRSHTGEEENNFYAGYNVKNVISKGSSLKICMIAEGTAEIYFRGGPTWEWDTAAGHAILLGAGGYFVNKDKSKLRYNKVDLKHQGFIASSAEIL